MDKISDVKIKPLENAPFKPFTMHYTQNGTKKNWDLIVDQDSVSIIVFNKSRQVFVFLRQFRPAVYYGCVAEEDRTGTIDTTKYPPALGITLELCSTAVPDLISLTENAKLAVHKHCGYNVQNIQFEKVASYRKGVGTNGSKLTVFYCEVTDLMRSDDFKRNDFIEIVEMSPAEARNYVAQKIVKSPSDFIFGIYWFLCTKNL